jgi:hypothetical protein
MQKDELVSLFFDKLYLALYNEYKQGMEENDCNPTYFGFKDADDFIRFRLTRCVNIMTRI